MPRNPYSVFGTTLLLLLSLTAVGCSSQEGPTFEDARQCVIQRQSNISLKTLTSCSDLMELNSFSITSKDVSSDIAKIGVSYKKTVKSIFKVLPNSKHICDVANDTDSPMVFYNGWSDDWGHEIEFRKLSSSGGGYYWKCHSYINNVNVYNNKLYSIKNEKCNNYYENKYQTDQKYKAFAVTKDGEHCGFSFGWRNKAAAANDARKRCEELHGSPCIVIDFSE